MTSEPLDRLRRMLHDGWQLEELSDGLMPALLAVAEAARARREASRVLARTCGARDERRLHRITVAENDALDALDAAIAAAVPGDPDR